jgi:hypothetical protein
MMMLTILATLGVPLAAVLLASAGGALLAPMNLRARRTVLQSQWSTRQTPIAAPRSGSKPA